MSERLLNHREAKKHPEYMKGIGDSECKHPAFEFASEEEGMIYYRCVRCLVLFYCEANNVKEEASHE